MVDWDEQWYLYGLKIKVICHGGTMIPILQKDLEEIRNLLLRRKFTERQVKIVMSILKRYQIRADGPTMAERLRKKM